MTVTQAAPLSSVATGRSDTLFAADIAGCRDVIAAEVTGKRILCIGGAGSIGTSTVGVLASFRPEALHIVDQAENALAEATRIFRNWSGSSDIADYRALPLDYGSEAARMFLHSQPAYDLILNFAALKHVRSEKDAFSTLQMLDTNLAKQAQLLADLNELGFTGRYFSVSTDKAANPTSLMGASKRVMEHVMFSPDTSLRTARAVTSARFANVAFSNGSLLQSFERRLERGEPLAAPRETKRYFVSLEESGQICAIAATVAPDKGIIVPRLDPRDHLIFLQEVAQRFLRHHGLDTALYEDETQARGAVERERAQGRWPLLLTPLDTSGEKPYEEFAGEGEQVDDIGLPHLLCVQYKAAPQGSVRRAIELVNELIQHGTPAAKLKTLSKDFLKDLIGAVEPGFLRTHRDSVRSLDHRM